MKKQKAKVKRSYKILSFCFALISLLATSPASARVTKVVIDKIESPTFEGQEFGPVGKYEKLTGRIFGEVDPNAPENVEIVNLDKATKNANGRVSYSANLYILKPVDLAKGIGMRPRRRPGWAAAGGRCRRRAGRAGPRVRRTRRGRRAGRTGPGVRRRGSRRGPPVGPAATGRAVASYPHHVQTRPEARTTFFTGSTWNCVIWDFGYLIRESELAENRIGAELTRSVSEG